MSGSQYPEWLEQNLKDHLRILSRAGPIPTDQFIHACLYHPNGGYYTRTDTQPGRAGDFYTSVSVGQQFGQLLAEHICKVERELNIIDKTGHFDLIEQGAHSGQLAADILRKLPEVNPDFPLNKLRLTLIEPQAHLRQHQIHALSNLLPPNQIRHLEHEEQLPHWQGVFYCNELIDAFPVRRFIQHGEYWYELALAPVGDTWQEVSITAKHYHLLELLEISTGQPVHSSIQNGIPHHKNNVENISTYFEHLKYTKILEIRPMATRWLRTITSRLCTGEILIFDYGKPDGPPGDTLRAFRTHKQITPWYSTPGLCDITADVDFSSLCLALCQQPELHISLQTQGSFLTYIFTAMDHERLRSGMTNEAWTKWCSAFNTLTHPAHMGTRFLVLRIRRSAE